MADSESNKENPTAEKPKDAKQQRQDLLDKISKPGGSDTDKLATWLELSQTNPIPEATTAAVEKPDDLNNPELIKRDQDNISRWLGYANQQTEKKDQNIEKHS